MARRLDKTMVTEDEGFDVAGDVGSWVERWMKSLGDLDPYNKQYVVRLVVDELDGNPPEHKEDES